MLTAQHLTKEYKLGNGKYLTVLSDTNIDIPEGKLVMIKGRSGSGKTTLLNILSTLDVPTKGDVFLDDRAYSSLGSKEKEGIRRHDMGFVFQSVALIPIMTAYENVDFGLRTAGVKEDHDHIICEALESVGLADRMKHMPREMSGGEQQRVAIARAFAHRPRIIFADEPTGALDTAGGIRVTLLFKELIERYGTTVVMTTHDTGLMELADIMYEL